MNNATPAEISSAIERAQKGLFAIQFPDGAWRSADVAGPPTTGWTLVALSYLGVAGQFDVAGAVRFLLFRQLPDGSFPDYPSDEKGSLAATAACYAGLYAVGDRSDQRADEASMGVDSAARMLFGHRPGDPDVFGCRWADFSGGSHRHPDGMDADSGIAIPDRAAH